MKMFHLALPGIMASHCLLEGFALKH
jgi:hypothetical protein